MTADSAQWIHMVGIAGAGMSGIARVLAEQGYRVSGSDLQRNGITTKLSEIGVEIFSGHAASQVREGVDLLVISSAIPQNNPEVQAARGKNIPVLSRGEMLAEIVNSKKGIAVAGAHGKTTTTSMIYLVLTACKLNPTFIVGGELQGSRLNACLGTGEYAVVEADESDASFLALNPYIAVITNVEDDHLDFYGSIEKIHRAFRQFVGQVASDGFALLYGEDQCNQRIIDTTSTKTITYGIKERNDYYLTNWQPTGRGSTFDVYRHNQYCGNVRLNVPGEHNAFNALAAVAIGLELGGDMNDIAEALKEFKGTGRRFEEKGSKNGVSVFDDYAHHPTEIQVTLEAARKVHDGRIITVFQPHRYTRTKSHGKKLGASFKNADLAIFTDIYSAGETPIAGISGKIVYESAREAGVNAVYIPSFSDIEDYLLDYIREKDMVMTMGAGDIWKVGVELLRKM